MTSRLLNNNAERSGIELQFVRLAPVFGIDLRDWVRDYPFHDVRLWKLDFARLDVLVAIELHGTRRDGSRHRSWSGFRKDREKINAATAMGWAVLEFTESDFQTDADLQRVCDTINTAVNLRLELAHA